MTCYGFPLGNLLRILSVPAMVPLSNISNPSSTNYNVQQCTYVPSSPTFGANLALNCSQNPVSTNFPNWLSTINNAYDLRAAFLKCFTNSTGTYYTNALPYNWPNSDEVLHTTSYNNGGN